MADQGFQEKSERATSKRRMKAREEGKVARSNELNAAAILCLGFGSMYLMGPDLARQTSQFVAYSMANAPTIAAADPTFIKIFGDSMYKFFMIMLPLFAVITVIALAVNVAQVGLRISTKAMEPRLDKLNIVNGLKRLFAVKSLVHLVRDTIKLLVIGLVAFLVIQSDFESFFMLPDMTVYQIASSMGKLGVILAIKIGAVVAVIAAIDYAYQKYEFEKSIKMSKQEIKEEHKDTEGSPQIKARVRQLQREMSRNRMLKSVPLADVVVTNPTHIAVALQYDQEQLGAPYVVAKGERLIAEKIKEIARDNNIPIVEDKPLARALFKICDVGQMVPMNLFRAVAEVLAYVYRLKGKVMS